MQQIYLAKRSIGLNIGLNLFIRIQAAMLCTCVFHVHSRIYHFENLHVQAHSVIYVMVIWKNGETYKEGCVENEIDTATCQVLASKTVG